MMSTSCLKYSSLHSGWLSTESANYAKAKKVLDLAVERLTSDPTLTFVWAEVIYLKRWYEAASETARAQLKK